MPPYLLLIFLLGATYGTIFHLWRGQTIRDLALYFLTGIIGMGLGQTLGLMLGFSFFLIGSVHIAEATVASWLSLFLMQWLKL